MGGSSCLRVTIEKNIDRISNVTVVRALKACSALPNFPACSRETRKYIYGTCYRSFVFSPGRCDIRVDVRAEGYRVRLWPMKIRLVEVQGQSNERHRPDERSNLCARGAAIGALTAGQSVADSAGKGPGDVSTGSCLRNLKGTPTSGGRREPEKRTSDVVCSAGAECRRSATSIC